MKKTIIILAFAFLANSAGAQTASYLENDIKFVKGNGTLTLTHYGERSVSERFGFTDYIFVSNGWAEFLAGPYFKPTKNSFVALYGGYETTNNGRLGAYAYWNTTENIFLSAFYEKGFNGSSDYYDFMARISLVDGRKIGLRMAGRLRQGYGYGMPIMLEFKNAFSEGFHAHIFFTQYYNVIEYPEPEWIQTVSLNFEF